MNAPKTLLEAIRHFSSADNCLAYVVKLRWPNGIECPRCGSVKHSFLATRRIWKCGGCRKQFSVKVGTIFEDSPIGLDKWLAALWMIVNAKNGVSSYEIHRALGVTQKTAWFMGHRIRKALQSGTFKKLGGEVEADETYIGGAARFMHKAKRKNYRGRGMSGKTIVMGLLERDGEARMNIIPNPQRPTLHAAVRANVEPGTELFTDALASYGGLSPEYAHQVIDHAECYAKGKIHTNGLENFWCLLKRALKGTYVGVEPFHLFRYLDEQSFRYNERKGTDSSRFQNALSQIAGKRVTYKELTGQTATA